MLGRKVMTEENNIVKKIQKNNTREKEIIQAFPADIGHLGQHRMLELFKRTYWWPGLKENIKKYVMI